MISSSVVKISVTRTRLAIARVAFLQMFFYLNGSPVHTDWILTVFASEKQGY